MTYRVIVISLPPFVPNIDRARSTVQQAFCPEIDRTGAAAPPREVSYADVAQVARY